MKRGIPGNCSLVQLCTPPNERIYLSIDLNVCRLCEQNKYTALMFAQHDKLPVFTDLAVKHNPSLQPVCKVHDTIGALVDKIDQSYYPIQTVFGRCANHFAPFLLNWEFGVNKISHYVRGSSDAKAINNTVFEGLVSDNNIESAPVGIFKSPQVHFEADLAKGENMTGPCFGFKMADRKTTLSTKKYPSS